jgi:hypothetical protein
LLLLFDHGDQRVRRDEHLPVHEPVSRVGDQVTDRPVAVVEVEFLHLPDFPVAAVQFIPLKRFGFE